MKEILALFVRALLVYGLLVLVMKIGGKRQIGELQLSELITALLISEVASAPIINLSTPIIHAVIPVVTVILLEILITFLTTKSRWLKQVFDGSPDIVIRRGKLDIKKLGKLRMSVDELIGEARQSGISDLADVEYALLEENGKFSFFEKAKKGDKEKGIAHTLVVDGVIAPEGVKEAQMTEDQVSVYLRERKIPMDEVFLLTVNDAGDMHLVKKPREDK